MPVPERGISLTAGELACEGVDTVLDAIAETGATAIGFPTGIIVEAMPDHGLREPSLDVDGDVRVLDRPLWGKRTLHIRHLAAHEPDPALWRDLPWDAPPTGPTSTRVDYPRLAIEGARQRDLRVYAQLAPYALPGEPAGEVRAARSSDNRNACRTRRLTGGLPLRFDHLRRLPESPRHPRTGTRSSAGAASALRRRRWALDRRV